MTNFDHNLGLLSEEGAYFTNGKIQCHISFFVYDVASDVGVNFKNVGVLSIESSLFHLFHYAFLHTKH